MIQTFLKTWPTNLVVYAEGCDVTETAPNLVVHNIAVVNELGAFKQQWQGVPKANGDVSADPVRSQRRDAGKGFKWDAVRFAHKVYSIFHCAKHTDTDWLIWMDADMVCHTPVSEQFLDTMCPEDRDLCFLGRKGKFSECGLYAMHLGTKGTTRFLKEFQRMYNDADNGIFLLDEWHDSFVFDAVRNGIDGLQQLNWSDSLGDLRASPRNTPGEGHPLINSAWGAYLDHLKGDDRKQAGHSHLHDIKVARSEGYWQGIR
jgi:hypothetical protein